MKRKRQGGEGMRCPKCGATKSSVIDSRQAEEGIRLEEDVSVKNVSIVLRPMNV